MGLDIRVPLGLLFLILGAIMALYGILTRNSTMYVSSMGVNLNMVWGSVMLLVGIVLFVCGVLSQPARIAKAETERERSDDAANRIA